jgi:hypothetical protein
LVCHWFTIGLPLVTHTYCGRKKLEIRVFYDFEQKQACFWFCLWFALGLPLLTLSRLSPFGSRKTPVIPVFYDRRVPLVCLWFALGLPLVFIGFFGFA